MKTVKKFISLLLSLIVLVLSNTMITNAAEFSGFCGAGISWSFDAQSGVLRISGNGRMYDYSNAGNTPWKGYADSIVSVIIENGIEYIGNYAFCQMTNLADVSVSSTLTEIGEEAFSSTQWLENNKRDFLTLNGILIYCESVSDELSLPENVSGICAGLFRNNQNIISVSSQYPVRIISDYAFSGCTNLESVNFVSLGKLGNGVFEGCTLLNDINLSDSISFIGTSCFDDTAWLNNSQEDFTEVSDILIKYKGLGGYVTIPDGLIGIADAFYSNSDVESVVIPDSVKYIGDTAFQQCDNLSCLTFGSGIKSIGKASFFGCESLTELFLPDSLEIISDNAFEDCYSVMTVCFPNGLTKIGKYSFASCYSLESVVLPDSLKSVGDYAFINCDALSSVFSDSRNADFGTRSIGYVMSNTGIIKTDNITLYGADNSLLHEYALNNRLQFKPYTCNHIYASSTVDAACDCFGFTLKKCRLCGYCSFENIVVPSAHDFSQWQNDNGYWERTCKLCRINEYDRIQRYNGWNYSYTTDVMEIIDEITVDPIFESCRKNAKYLYLNGNSNLDFSDSEDLRFVCADGINGIHTGMFNYCRKLECVMLSDSVKLLESGCFAECNTLSKLFLPDADADIASDALPQKTDVISTPKFRWKPYSDRLILLGNYETAYSDGFNDLPDESAADYEFVRMNEYKGTGAEFSFKIGNIVVAETVAVIYGDLNADGIADGTDAVLANVISSGLSIDNTLNGAVFKAADCDRNGIVDENDVTVISEAGVLLHGIEQGG